MKEVILMYREMNLLVFNEDFLTISRILNEFKVEESTVDEMLAVLTVTLRIHDKIEIPRRSFFEKVKSELDKRGVHEEGLLSGLG